MLARPYCARPSIVAARHKLGRSCTPSHLRMSSVSRATSAPGLQLLCFDCDGVLVDTERDGHRVSFNEAFKRKGLEQHVWDEEMYEELLTVGGGKERMTKYFQEHEDEEPFKSIKTSQDEAQGCLFSRWTTPQDADARTKLVQELHLLKTDLFMGLIESGALPLRPGVKRLVGEAMAAGVPVAVCSTSNERAVSTIVHKMLGPEAAAHIRIFAGDMVPKKKPDPAIYLLAAREMGVDPARCVVVEDSNIGLKAAKAAGMTCFVTKSHYTGNEDFADADAVYDCIGEAGEERFFLSDLQKAVASKQA